MRYWITDYCDLCNDYTQVCVELLDDDCTDEAILLCEECLASVNEADIKELRRDHTFKWEEV